MMNYAIYVSLLMMRVCSSQDIEFCHTSKCNEKAAFIADVIDYDVDPCDNFYKFSCGRWHHLVGRPESLHAIGRGYWKRILDEFLISRVRGRASIVHTFYIAIRNCSRSPPCIRRILEGRLGLVANIAIVSNHSNSIYYEDASSIVKRVYAGYQRELVFTGTSAEFRRIHGQTKVILVSKETLPSIQTLQEILTRVGISDPEQLILNGAYKPRWVRKGFTDFTLVIINPKYDYISK